MPSVKILRVRMQMFFRKMGLLSFVERLRFFQSSLKYRKSNKKFLKENRGFELPPAHLAFDAYDAPKWKFYKESGEMTARFLKEMVDKYCHHSSVHGAIYEWGCGPGRVIRHLPQLLGNGIKVYGSDYNAETISWCKEKIPGVEFQLNGITPPLTYANDQFDFIYCISVFTHLAEETGLQWAEELYRVLKPGGVLLITTLGEHSYHTELLPPEKRKYEKEGIVVRGQYNEGRKMYLAIHNPEYIRSRLLKDFEILERMPGGFPYMTQECWIARKTII